MAERLGKPTEVDVAREAEVSRILNREGAFQMRPGESPAERRKRLRAAREAVGRHGEERPVPEEEKRELLAKIAGQFKLFREQLGRAKFTLNDQDEVISSLKDSIDEKFYLVIRVLDEIDSMRGYSRDDQSKEGKIVSDSLVKLLDCEVYLFSSDVALIRKPTSNVGDNEPDEYEILVATDQVNEIETRLQEEKRKSQESLDRISGILV